MLARWRGWLALLLAATACSSGSGGTASLGAAPAGVTTAATAPAATTTTAAVPGCPGVPPRKDPPPDRPRYVMSLDITPNAARVTGTIAVRFTPPFDTDRLQFRLWPDGGRQATENAHLDITGPVVVGTEPVTASTDADPTIAVVRPTTTRLTKGTPVDVKLAFALRLPHPARDRISAESDSVRLGSFFPLLEYVDTGWTSDPPTSRFAEASTAPAADFDLTITTPPGYDTIASGTPDHANHWTAVGMRDIAVAVGHFAMATGTAHVPNPVQVIAGVDASVHESPQAYLDRAISTLEAHSKRFGPYPWPTFAISVTPGIATGIEYPGHILHGPSTATDVETHEVGHQWFYALVGNNQARDPWLDEALTTWVEARYEGTVDQYKATVIPADVAGRTTESMTFWDQSDNFYLGAYVQGMQALAALGPPDQVDCALRIYANDQAYRIATAADLLADLTRVFPDAAAVLARYGIHA